MLIESPQAVQVCWTLPVEKKFAADAFHVDRKPLECVVMQVDNTPVTLAIAKAGEFKTTDESAIDRNGVRYGVQNSGGVHIVTFARNGHRFALIGSVSAERLVDFAHTLKL
ncbi:hypothetical protein BH10PLA1_BH10PLA1_13000 [soil metagenome]